MCVLVDLVLPIDLQSQVRLTILGHRGTHDGAHGNAGDADLLPVARADRRSVGQLSVDGLIVLPRPSGPLMRQQVARDDEPYDHRGSEGQDITPQTRGVTQATPGAGDPTRHRAPPVTCPSMLRQVFMILEGVNSVSVSGPTPGWKLIMAPLESVVIELRFRVVKKYAICW